MKYLWLALLASPLLGLPACSYIMPVTGGDENGGTVHQVATAYGEDNAMVAARDHCAQYHRHARKLRTDTASNTMSFTCEEPGRPQEPGNPPGVTDRPYR